MGRKSRNRAGMIQERKNRDYAHFDDDTHVEQASIEDKDFLIQEALISSRIALLDYAFDKGLPLCQNLSFDNLWKFVDFLEDNEEA